MAMKQVRRFNRWLMDSPQGIKTQVILYLHWTRCYDSVNKYWLAKYSKFVDKTCTDSHTQLENSSFTLPRLYPWLKLYYKVSILVFTYVLIKSTLPIYAWLDQASNLSQPTFHCFLMGRFIVYDKVNHNVAVFYGVIHQLWILVQSGYFRNLNLNLAQFLYQQRQEYIYRKLESDSHKQSQLTPNELFLRDVICYKISWDRNNIAYKIKPNRTLEAKRNLERKLAYTTWAVLLAFSILALMMAPYMAISQHRATTYVRRYPNCSPDLEQQLNNGKISKWWAILNPHFVISLSVDIIENMIVWGSSGFAYFLVIALAHMLNYDLILYWYKIHDRLKALEQKLRTSRLCCCIGFRENLGGRHDSASNQGNEILEVQNQIFDFFKQLRACDCFISDMISLSLLISLLYGTLVGIKTRIEVIQLFALIALMAENLNLLSLSRKVNKSYCSICSIMALDLSIHKSKFPVILELYSKRNFGPFYTLFHMVAYPTAAFISVIGWTFTVYVMSNSLFRTLRLSEPNLV